MHQRVLNYQSILGAFLLAFLLILVGCGAPSAEVQPIDETKQQLNDENLESVVPIEDIDIDIDIDVDVDKQEEDKIDKQDKGELAIHYIDVGQGDATLFIGPDFTILIDAGRHNSSDVTPYLREQGVSDIDLMILTHPHSDHIGQADIILKELKVKEVWMSGDEHTTQTFERVLDATLESGADYHEPRAGETFEFGSAFVEVVNPLNINGNLHAGSVSVRISFGDIKFLFTGDAEHQTEADMINRGHDLEAHFFQLGHHGSSTSNTPAFLNKVKPEVAIYSAKAENSYGHPHDEIVSRINNMGIDLYGTDVHGTIIVTTDGEQYTVETNKSGAVTETSNYITPKEADSESESESESEVKTNSDCININTASKEQLEKITHLSTVRITELIQLRPFSSIEELTEINGIGPARLADIKEQGLACSE
ncbi:MBL fold metallo-hydrolase [Bacillaceae bacterium IKA-2]|nr:MBL fold metallo-hydrolase [Bacillaceae bacterium IKA-2]